MHSSSGATSGGVHNPFAKASRAAIVYLVPLDAHSRMLLTAVVPQLEPWLPSGTQITAMPTSTA